MRIESLEDLVALPGPGEALFLSFQHSGIAERFRTPLLLHLSRVRRTGLHVVFGGEERDAREGTSLRRIVLGAPGGVEKSLATLKKETARLRKKSLVLMDCVPFQVRPEGQALKLIRKGRALAARRSLPSLWLFESNRFSDADWADLKDESGFFLRLFSVGGSLFAQFIKADGVYDDSFFLPRRVKISESTMEFSSPGIPAAVPRQGEAEGSVPPVVDLLEMSYKRVFDSSPDGIILFDWKAEFREANRRACEMFGYSPAEMRTVRLVDLVCPADRIRVLRGLASLRRKGKSAMEAELLRKSGRTFTASMAASSLERGRSMVVLRDATEAAAARESHVEELNHFRDIFSSSPLAQAIIAGRKLAECNEAFRLAFSLPAEGSVEGRSLLDVLGKRNAAAVRELLASSVPAGRDPNSRRVEVIAGGAEGEERIFEAVAAPLPQADRQHFHLFCVDVTTRKRALQILGESEQRCRSIIEAGIGAISVVRGGKFAFVNRAFALLFGYGAAHELTQKEIALTAVPRQRSSMLQQSEPANALGGPPTQFVYTGLRKDGSTVEIEATGETILFGGAPSLLCYHRSIAEQQEAEDRVRRTAHSQQIINHLADAAGGATGVAEIGEAGLAAAVKWLGADSGGLYLRTADESAFELTAHTGLSERVLATLSEQSMTEGVTGFVVKTQEPLVVTALDYPPYLPYKSLFESEGWRVVTYLPLLVRESTIGILLLGASKENGAVVRDPLVLATVGRHLGSALVRAEEHDRLAAAERLHRSVLESIPDVAYRLAPNGSVVYLAPQVEKWLGYKPAEFLASSELWRSVVHPDDRSAYSMRVVGHGGDASESELEYRVLPKGKASYRRVRDAVHYERNERGEIASITGILTDITSRAEKIEELSRSEGLKTNLIDSMSEGVLVCGRDLNCTAWNPAMERLTGISRQEMVGRGVLEEPLAFRKEQLEPLFRRGLEGEDVSSDDLICLPGGSGEEHLLSGRFSPVRDREGAVQGVIVTMLDITQRKSLEREARESEETLREVVDAMGDALMISDLQGRIWEVNREFTRLTGYARGEVLGTIFPYPWLIDEETARFVRWISELRERHYLRDFDMTWRHRNGRETAISLNTTLLRNASGEPVAMLNIARDISERRRLGNELATKNKQIEMLNRIISKANRTVDFAEIFESVAEEVRALLPFDEINVGLLTEEREHMLLYACVSGLDAPSPIGETSELEKTVSRLAVKEGRAVVVGNLLEHPEMGPGVLSAQQGLKSQVSIPIILNGKVLGTFNVASLEANAFGSDDLVILQPIADQIGSMIDRSRLFQRVSDDSSYIHTLLNSINSIVVTIDQNYRIREVNEAWREFAGLQGLDRYRDEAAVIGAHLKEVVTVPSLWDELDAVLPRLFDQTLAFYATELTLGEGGGQRDFQLIINPMSAEGVVTGLVFTHTDITEIVRTEAEIKRRNEELVVLNAISSSITKSLNLEEVLDVAFTQMKQMAGADTVACYLRDKEKNKLVLARTLGVPADIAPEIQILEVAPRPGRAAAEERGPLLLRADTMTDERVTPTVRQLYDRLGRKNLVALPLQSKDRVLGALVLGFSGERQPRDQDDRFLTLLGNQLGSAIDNAQLYAEVQAQVQRITSLYELGKGLTGALDTRGLLELVHAEVSRAIPCRVFSYDTYVSATSSLHPVFTVKHPSGGEIHVSSGGDDIPLPPASSLSRLIAEGTPFIGVTADGEPVMAVPVKSQQRVSGILSVTGERGVVYHETYLRLLESIANLTEIALDRASLYEDTVAKSREIENRNRELDDFAYVVSHDLKEPLITIEGYSKIVLGDYREHLPDAGKQYLGSIVESSTRMKSLIDDLLTLSRVGRVTGQPDTVSVRDVINDVLHDFEFTLRERGARVHIPEVLPHLRYNATQLGMVFRNLISNAVKFNSRQIPEVTINAEERSTDYVFSIHDNGIGIAREHYDRIFVIFQRLHRQEEYRGTGAGLTIVKKIVEKHHGRIWVESVVGEGTTVFFTVPR